MSADGDESLGAPADISPDLMKVVEHLANNDTHHLQQKQGPGDVTG